jgi:N-acetylmuramoyl-L-alanine amidase
MTPEQKSKVVELKDEEVMALTLYGEARGASFNAKLGMAQVMWNRANDGRFGKGIKEVVTKPKQFSCFNDNDVNLPVLMEVVEDFGGKFTTDVYLRECYAVALGVINGSIRGKVKDSLYYHTTGVNPKWNKGMTLEAKIGNTLFWKEK